MGKEYEFMPVCPEAVIGLTRQMIHLVGYPHYPRQIGTLKPNLDVNLKMQAYAVDQENQLDDISGYILK